MAGKNAEEEYLDKLLRNAMEQDASIENITDNSIEDSIEQETEQDNESVNDDSVVSEEEIQDLFSEIAVADELASELNESITDNEIGDAELFENVSDASEATEDITEHFEETDVPVSEDTEITMSEESEAPIEGQVEHPFEDNGMDSDELMSNLENIINNSPEDEEDSQEDEDTDIENSAVEDAKSEEEEIDAEALFRQLQDNPYALDDIEDDAAYEDGQVTALEEEAADSMNTLDESAEEELSEEDINDILNGNYDLNDENQEDDSEDMFLNGFDEEFNLDDFVIEEPEPKAKKKSKKDKKVKADKKKNKPAKADKKKDKNKDKKKSGLMAFFVEEEENSDDKKDVNQMMIDELYKDKDSLDEEPAAVDDSKNAKQKKVKEKKTKKVKEKKPKKVKPEKPKAPENKKNLIPIGSIFKTVLFAGIVIAAIIVSSNLIAYNKSVKSANNLFAEGRYRQAYDKVNGLKLKDKDIDIYNKCRYVVGMMQAIESYENCMTYDDVAGGIDALIRAVGRKGNLEEEYAKYGIESIIKVYYDKILEILSVYDISEEDALSCFSMQGTLEYNNYLAKYRGTENDSNN